MRFRAFSRQQRRVLTWWCSAEGQSREAVICDGAVRSGKTLCMGLAFFLWATACFDGMAFGLCGKTITALRRNLLREVLPTLGALGFQWREQALPKPADGTAGREGEHLLPLWRQRRGKRGPDSGHHAGGGSAG